MIGFIQATAGTLLTVLALVLAVSVGEYTALRRGVDARWQLWMIAGAGLLAARLGYVWEFHAAYFAAPLSILDIRDGGWSGGAGFAVICLYGLRIASRNPSLIRPIRWGLLTGGLVWMSGSIALAISHTGVDGVPLPGLKLVTAAGEPVDLQAFRDKPIVLNLWATWCPPCNREMPMLAAAQAAHPDLQFVFVDQGESAADVSAWMVSRQLAMRNVVIDPAKRVGAALDQRAFPTTYFFDAEGRPVARRIGELSLATLTEKIALLVPPAR